MKKYIILSIDGGGIRGLIPSIILSEIEKATGKKIINIFDFFAGTSTGGLIISALTKSNNTKSIEEILAFYNQRGCEIFPKRKLYHKILNYFKPLFNNKGLEKVLSDNYNNETLADTLKPIMISAYNLSSDETSFFKTRKAIIDSTYNYKLYDICMATTSAPTTLPVYNLDNINYIDGGVYINNPALGALIEFKKHSMFYTNKKLKFENIKVLSLGTGVYKKNRKFNYNNWGLLKWATAIPDIMMIGSKLTVNYQMEELLKNNFLRVDIDLNDKYYNISDSSTENVEYLTTKTYEFINSSKFTDLVNFVNQ